MLNKNFLDQSLDTFRYPFKKSLRVCELTLPTHDELEAAKAHLKDVDNAQEVILEAMFDDLRNSYQTDLSKKNVSEVK